MKFIYFSGWLILSITTKIIQFISRTYKVVQLAEHMELTDLQPFLLTTTCVLWLFLGGSDIFTIYRDVSYLFYLIFNYLIWYIFRTLYYIKQYATSALK